MGRSLKYDIPGTDWRRGPLEIPADDLTAFFSETLGAPFDVVLEIGFGRGEFLLDLAAKASATAFIGVEVSFKRVLKMARKLARSGLQNVRIVEGRAELIVRDLIPPGSLSEVWINFSDPWPKDRHANRRLIRAPFIADLAPRLREGGLLHVATDHPPYAEQIHAVLAAEPGLESTHPERPWHSEIPGRMHTGYESEWRAEGRALHFFEYRRPSLPVEGPS
jgi:tRNA (guanine-N7-)-methyltransferase